VTPDELCARVLLRDANLIILDKPAGLAVHAGPRAQDTIEALLPGLSFGLRHVPALAHRLDQDTGGCLVLARHPKALSRLGRLFGAGKIEKTYWAVVEGDPPASAGTIELKLAKVTGPAGWRMIIDPDKGQNAVSDWRLLGRGDGLSWLEIRPRTGRTHQIRVHLAALGWPILGDPFYGRADPAIPMQLLSRRIGVPYWEGRPPVSAEAPPPAHMRGPLTRCGWLAGTQPPAG
jgi:tRNA pseudouridine32 synthase / 23S rRNA pseudouridine746 synthase